MASPPPPSASNDAKGFYATLGLGAAWPQNVTGDTTVGGLVIGATGFSVDNVNYDPLNSWGARLGARYRF